ncbi:hypothetical protein NQ317_005808 [Molorchus minor]|uniref:Ribosome biogenesis protein SLX9 n=1 Tax=Molorchus minor TaxID=1323400 RepID=A0ABQ9J879_9CUCU|nr:hypothetical protein NQ317_005808 [Molorchus minor]
MKLSKVGRMGKVKRQRQRLHISSKNQPYQENDYSIKDITKILPITSPKEDLFSEININFASIKKMPDDVGSETAFVKKIDTANQMKKELKIRKNRKNNVVMGDTNPLHDALPSLESLLKSRTNIKSIVTTLNTSKKGIVKAKQRKKKFVHDMTTFKQTLNNENFKANPFGAISHHITSLIEHEHKLNYSVKLK